jgi:hypothetical protein
MSSFTPISNKKHKTCEDSGHQCGLISLLHLGLITQEQYSCLMKIPGFCVPGIGTNPSKILDLLNGVIKDCPDVPKTSWFNQKRIASGNRWLRFDCAVFRTLASTKGTTTAAEIYEAFNGITGYNPASRLVLHLTIGQKITDTKGHYIMYNGENGKVRDPFDPRLNSWIFNPTEIEFERINLAPNPGTEQEYIFFLVNPDAEFINLGFGARTGTDIVDANKCRETEDPIMAAFIAAPEKCPGPIMYVGGPEPDYIKKDNSKKRGRAGGGKTNTKKKYRAKTIISTNKYAKRHRIRRSRRKSQGNRINNGKH